MNPAFLARCHVTRTTASTNGENGCSLHDLVAGALHLRRRTLPILLRTQRLTTRPNRLCESCLRPPTFLPDLFEDFLETRVPPKRLAIGVMLHPSPCTIVR